MMPNARKMLKLSGGLSIFTGFIITFVGFYFMANGMSLNSVTPDTEEAVLRTMRYISAGGMYMMVFGVYSIYAGFRGLMNAQDSEYIRTLKNIGYIYVALCVLNIIIIIIVADVITPMNIAICVVPVIISLIYTAGAVIQGKCN